MDDSQLESLKAALLATPHNAALLGVVLRELLDRGQSQDACALLPESAASLLDEKARLLAAEACLAAGDAERAMGFLDLDLPAAQLLRARALLALDRLDEGRKAYDRAVAANPGLEDTVLRTRLSARVHAFTGEGGPRLLRVIEKGEPKELDTLLKPGP